MLPERSFTVRELAAKIGVSKATVSMALRNHPRLSEKTRRRVQEEAARLGYRPNALVAALMTQVRTRRVKHSGEGLAYLTAYGKKNEWRGSPTSIAYYEGAMLQAERLGFRLEQHWLGPLGVHSRQIARMLRARAVRGMILAPVPLNVGDIQLDWADNLVISLGYSFGQQPLHRVAHHHFNGVLTCYERLRRAGRRRIGLVMHREADERVHHYWTAGFHTGRQVHGGAALPLLLQDDWHGSAADRAQFLRWFEKNRPDGVVGIMPDFPLVWMKDEGVKVPAEVGYVGLDLDPSQLGQIAGVMQNSEALGAAAVDLLVSGLQRNERGVPRLPRITLMDGVWCDGKSMGGNGSA